MSQILAKKYLFPHDGFRPSQAKFVAAVGASIAAKKQIIVHAPTGLGKTAATLAPAVQYAIENKKTVFFLTSRHTQHMIALQTLQQIKNKHNIDLGVVDLYGKQHMCLQEGIMNLSSNEFRSYCKDQREQRLCSFYCNARKTSGTLDVAGKAVTEQLSKNIIPLELLKSTSQDFEVCPYEISMELAKEATVIVADYFHIFNDTVRNSFFNKLEISLEDCIVVVDESHNIPNRIKELASAKLTSRMFALSIREADKAQEEQALQYITELKNIFEQHIDDDFKEKTVNKQFMSSIIDEVTDYDDLIETLSAAGTRVRDEKKSSFMLGLCEFFSAWQGTNVGFTRILSKRAATIGATLELQYACLDPRVVMKPILDQLHSAIFMSGTLQPLTMYQDLLGVNEDATLLEFPHPFPKENVRHLVVPQVTTKYAKRSEKQFDDIAKIISDATNAIPGNTAIFFQSYDLMAIIGSRLQGVTKPIFTEVQNMSTQERQQLIAGFRSYADSGGALLMGVSSGSFGEGIDLPGDLLKGVIVIGIPLAPPDLLLKELVKYYQEKFGRGWDYGYLIPAFNVVMQNAGRCIRSETDKGVILYLDERYATQFQNYFPKDTHVQIANNVSQDIQKFFEK